MENKKRFLFPLIIAALTLAAFWPALSAGFTNWDDQLYVTQNPFIRELSPRGISEIFSSFHRGLYKPLVFLSYAVEYRFFGLNPFIYHADNLALHILNALLVYYFLGLFFGGKKAFLAAILFSVHPLRVESVVWIAERKDVLCSFFLLASLAVYARYALSGGKWKLASSAALYALSMLANSKAVAAPLALLLVDWLAQRKLSKKTLAEKIPHVLIALALTGLNY